MEAEPTERIPAERRRSNLTAKGGKGAFFEHRSVLDGLFNSKGEG